MGPSACVVGRLTPGGAWVGFAPTLDDGYALVVDGGGAVSRGAATPADLVALAVLYFEERGEAPPEDVGATHGDIAGIVRHAALRVTDAGERRRFDEAVDAIDDGLAADVVIERLVAALGEGTDALEHLRARTAELTGEARQLPAESGPES